MSFSSCFRPIVACVTGGNIEQRSAGLPVIGSSSMQKS